MTTKIRARLASRPVIEQALTATVLAPLALGLSQDALEHLARSLRGAAYLYLEERSRRTPKEVQEELGALKRRVDRVLDAPANEAARHDAIAAVSALSGAALEVLEIGTPSSWFRSLDELLAALRATAIDADDYLAMTADEAFQHLAGLCVRTARPVAGRKRPTGRQSAPRLQWTSVQPPAPRARPAHTAEQRLCLMVAVAYVEATGKWPTCWGLHAPRPSPFTRLMKAVLTACSARSVDARELVRWYLRHHAKPAAGAKKVASPG